MSTKVKKPKPEYRPKELTDDEKQEEQVAQYLTMGAAAGCSADQMVRFITAGIVLQEKQLMFAAACRECDKADGPTAVGFGGARGGAKTHSMMSQIGADDCQRYPGLKVLFLRKVGKANKEQFDDFRRKVFAGLPHNYREQRGILTFDKSGSTIVVGHFQNEKDIDNYLGLEYDIIALEEATTLTFSKWKNVLTCLRTSKPGWRPRAYLTTNPGNIGHAWFKQVFVTPYKTGTQAGTRFIPSTVRDNKFCNTDYVKILESLHGWQKRAWLDGDWDIAAGQYFTNWRETTHVVESFHEGNAISWFASLDYGFNHYTVFHLGCMVANGDIYIVETHRGRNMVVQDHAQKIKSMLERHRLVPWQLDYIASGRDCFSRHPDGTTISEQYAREGIPLVPAEIDRENGWSEMLRRLGDPDNGIKPSLFVHRRCQSLIDQIPVMQHDPNRPEDVQKVDVSEDGSGGDDDVDSVRMLLATNPNVSLSWAKPIGMGKYKPMLC